MPSWALLPETSIYGKRVVRELTDLIAVRGKYGMIVSENGAELSSNAVLEWFGTAKIDWHYRAPDMTPAFHQLRLDADGFVAHKPG